MMTQEQRKARLERLREEATPEQVAEAQAMERVSRGAIREDHALMESLARNWA